MAWKSVPFGAVFQDVSSGSPRLPQSDYLVSGVLPVVDQGVTDIAGFTDDLSMAAKCELPVIVFGDHTRRIKLVDRPFAVGADGVKLLQTSSELDVRYAFHYLRSSRLPNAGYSRHFKFLRDVSIPLPPQPEQRRIASILDEVDFLRNARKGAIEQLQGFSTGLFESTFGTPDATSWPVGTIADLVISASYGTSAKAGVEGNQGVLRMGNLTSAGALDLTDLKRIDIADRDRDKYLVHTDDVLFNRTNSAELVGKSARYWPSEPMAYAGYLVRLRPRAGHSGHYIAGFLNSPWAKARLRGMAKSIVGMANINAKEVQSIPAPIPTSDAQSEFAVKCELVDSARRVEQLHLAKLDELFASLQHRAFRGEL